MLSGESFLTLVPYHFTGNRMESDKCHLCQRPIQGEEAEYVRFVLPVAEIRNTAARMPSRVVHGIEAVRVHFVNHVLNAVEPKRRR